MTFATQSIRTAEDGGFVADALLTVKGEPHPIIFSFTVLEQDELLVLKGGARLDRLALGIGTGEWADPTWVGQFVDVDVKVTAVSF